LRIAAVIRSVRSSVERSSSTASSRAKIRAFDSASSFSTSRRLLEAVHAAGVCLGGVLLGGGRIPVKADRFLARAIELVARLSELSIEQAAPLDALYPL